MMLSLIRCVIVVFACVRLLESFKADILLIFTKYLIVFKVLLIIQLYANVLVLYVIKYIFICSMLMLYLMLLLVCFKVEVYSTDSLLTVKYIFINYFDFLKRACVLVSISLESGPVRVS